jgi:hypothetical protein
MMSDSKVLAFSVFLGPHAIFSSIVCMHVDQGVMECVTSGSEFVCEKFKQVGMNLYVKNLSILDF